jgi:hypothetical protein
MVHIRHTASNSTQGHLTIRQLAPRGTPRQQEESTEPQQLEHVEPEQEESAEPLQKEKLAEPQHEEDAIHSQGDNNDPSDYTPLSDPNNSDSEPEPIQAASEFHSYGEESLTVPAQLHGLLFQLGITKAPE